MANTKFILDKIKIEDKVAELITRTDAENTSVTYNGAPMTLASALASIYASLSGLPTGENVDSKISAAIDGLIGGAPETYNTLKKIADYIATHEDIAEALDSAIGGKVDKVEGKGLSSEDFTTALKNKLESLPEITAEQVATWTDKADKTEATQAAAGLMSAADKTRLDNLRGVRFGTEVPSDMQNGELFVRIVSEQ